MSLISFEFLIALPVAALIYYLIPARFRYLWICALSLAFYATQGVRLLVVMLLSIVSTYVAGRMIRGERDRLTRGTGALSDSAHETPDTASSPEQASFRTEADSRGLSLDSVASEIAEPDSTPVPRVSFCMLCTILFNVALIIIFKYAGLIYPPAAEKLLNAGLFAPVGIMFYVLQATGYVIDCARGDVEPEKNIFLYTAFVAFFPLVISGPIERAPRMLPQLKDPKGFEIDTVRDGLLMMVWGFFCKLVIADRIAIFVNTAYASPDFYAGGMMALAVVLYAMQIYCDFMGYSYIAAGTARVFGFEVIDNFDAPYLSGTIAEFWHRWHRSLSTWFRDYLYIPLGGNRKGQGIKLRNLLIVFAVSGLWHGAAWRFLLWGLVHGMYQVLGTVTQGTGAVAHGTGAVSGSAHETPAVTPGTVLLCNASVHREPLPCVAAKLFTFIRVALAWIFFRAESMEQAGAVFKSLCTLRVRQLFDGTIARMGLDIPNVVLMCFALAVLVCADVMRYRGVRVREALSRQVLWLRWPVYIGAVVLIVICGVWGAGYDAASFIYAQF